jgi:hypothetical protein
MIPTFPPDATIMSIHLACLRVGRAASIRRSLQTFYLGPMELNNRFGHRAGAFVQGALNDNITAERLIDQHSAFPYFASLVTEDVATRWRAALIEGHPDAFRRYLPATRHGLRFANALRHCHECQQSDIEQYGLAHWHVVHQLPGIRFCPEHNHRLHDRCGSCKTPLGGKSKAILPGAACQRCGSHGADSSLSKHPSHGYQSLADLICRTLQRQAPEAAPTVRHRLLKHLISTAGVGPVELVDRFLTWWSVETLTQLGDMLQSPIDAQSLQQLMQEGHAKVSTPLMLAVIAFAWAHTSDADRTRLLQGDVAEDDLFANGHADAETPDDVITQLMALARQLHLPSRAAELLSQGDRSSTTDLIGRTNVLLLIEGVSERARGLLAQRIREHQNAV